LKKVNIWIKMMAGMIVLLAFIVSIFKFQKNEKTLNINDLKIDTVSLGNVYNVINASGEVEAENEVLLLCPYTSIVRQIIKPPGSEIKKGEVIVALDETGIEKRIENLRDELEMLNNNLLKLTLSAKTVKMDMDHNIDVKKLQIISLESELNDQEALIDVGGTSQANIDKTKQELLLARKDLTHTSQKHKIKLQQLEAEERGIALQIEMKEKQLKEAIDKRKKLLIVSPDKGVVLEVKARKGEIVKENELLVRISEHTRLKIKAQISDKQQNIIKNGGKVFVLVEDQKLEGTIGNIRPVIEDDKIKFEVFLKNPKTDMLRVNKKVDLLVVTEERSNVLRIKKEFSFENPRKDFCYKVENSNAIFKEIETGLFGDEYVEIKKGLDTGDIIIISDVPAIKKRNIIEIR